MMPPDRPVPARGGSGTDASTRPPVSERASEARRAAVRDVLTDVAMELFRQNGFDDITVEAITTAAGVSLRTFYRYFPSKEDLLVHWALRTSQYFAASLDGRPIEEPIRQASFRAAATWSARQEQETQDLINVLERSPSARAAVNGRIVEQFQALVARAIAHRTGEHDGPGSDAELLAAVVVAVVSTSTRQWMIEGGDRCDTVSAMFAHLERLFATGD